jgi:hypothetical protein
MRLRVYRHPQVSVCEVSLSRRNLLALLYKLEMAGSSRTLAGGDCPEGFELVVRVEGDDEHYAKREEGPGPMHPQTEAFLQAQGCPPPIAVGSNEASDLDAEELPAGLERPEPGFFRQGVLGQSEVWFDRHTRMHRLAEMPLEYLLNVISFLERLADSLYAGELLTVGLNAMHGREDDRPWSPLQFDEPLEWLRATPLMKALAEQAEQRVVGGRGGDAADR